MWSSEGVHPQGAPGLGEAHGGGGSGGVALAPMNSGDEHR